MAWHEGNEIEIYCAIDYYRMLVVEERVGYSWALLCWIGLHSPHYHKAKRNDGNGVCVCFSLSFFFFWNHFKRRRRRRKEIDEAVLFEGSLCVAHARFPPQ